MRHVNKVLLGHEITDGKKEKPKNGKKRKHEETEQVEDEGGNDENCPEDLTSQDDTDTSNASRFVLDGGDPGKTQLLIILFKTTSVILNSKYGLCSMVFDGYNSRSTKDHNIEDVQLKDLRVSMFL